MMKILRVCLISLISLTAIASEKSVYDFSWLDKDKEVYVLQNRKFRKDGKLYVALNGVKTISGAFIDSYGASARVGYFLKEDWGVEFLYGKNSGDQNDTFKAIGVTGTIPFYRKVDTMMGGLVWWSPFYAKINTFNQIFYFDWMFGLGLAQVTTLDNRNRFVAGPNQNEMTSESNMGGLWSTSMRFHINQAWSLRLDFLGTHFNATKRDSNNKESSSLFSNYDLSMGLVFAF
jgi:outer membrane beta-barrel protein